MSLSTNEQHSNYTIVPVTTEQQLLDALAVRTAVFVQEQQVPSELEVDERDTLSPEHSGQACYHFVMYDDKQEAIATARYYIYNNDNTTAKLQRIAVLRTSRGLGLGKAMILYMEQHIHNHALTHIILDAQLTAVGFYEQLGYSKQSEQTFLDAGILHVRMEKQL